MILTTQLLLEHLTTYTDSPAANMNEKRTQLQVLFLFHKCKDECTKSNVHNVYELCVNDNNDND